MIYALSEIKKVYGGGTVKKIKSAVLEMIVSESCDLFLDRSVESVTVNDVAEKSGVGVATIYRYFSTKQNLLEKCAVKLQKEVYENYFRLTGRTGAEKLSGFYSGYIKVFDEHREFYKFISEFDAFVIAEGGVLEEYSAGADLFKREYLSAYEEGLRDKSVRKNEDIETFYYATTHALLELCKKLAVNGKVVKQDDIIEKEKEIRTIVNAVIRSLID